VLLASSLALDACKRSEGASPAPEASAHSAPTSSQRISIAVTSDGFVPSGARVKAGQPVTLVVTRQVERTCATEIVIKEYAVNQPVPQGQPVEVTFTPAKPGPIRYACAMDMIAGELIAE
jgi:plastocyanin domain-containing protein